MPLPLGCSSGALVLTAAITLLLLPAPYLVPDFFSDHDDKTPLVEHPPPPQQRISWDRIRAHCPALDLFATFIMLIVGFFTYLCEWIQRKLMERRIVKLNQYLFTSVERLRAWDAQQEQLESTLRLVQGAAGEYNLLLFLLLRRRRTDKELDDLASLPTLDV